MFAMKPRTVYLFRVLLSAAVMLQAFMPGVASVAQAARPKGTTDEIYSSASTTLSWQGLMGYTGPFKPGRIALEEVGTPTAEPTLIVPPEVTPIPVATATPVPTPTSNPQTGTTDLAVEFSADTKQARAGDQVSFTLKITNTGKTAMTEFRFSNILPDGFNYVPSEKDGFKFDSETRELSWVVENESTLPAGQSLTLE